MSKIIGFNVTMNSYVTYDSSNYNSSDEWSRQSTSTDWKFSHAVTTYDYPDANLYLSDDEEIPHSLYLVSVIYDTGDSFGNDSCRHIEHLMVYKNYAYALACKKIVEEQDESYREHKSSFYSSRIKKKEKFVDTLTIPNGDGTEKEFPYIPWHGCFERLASVEIYQFVPRILN